jgi:signal transduction histidine kinase
VRITRLEGALDTARRQASVGALISGVAHDFNNMLSVMLGYARLMADEAQGSELLSEGVTEIEAAARRAMQLSRSLVDLGRVPETEPKVLEVGAVVDEVVQLLHRTLGDRITLQTQISAPELHVLMPPGELDRAIVNLVANARDALPGGGVVLIHVEHLRAGGGQPAGSPHGEVVIEVRDDGIGMEPEVLERALEPSFTTKAKGEGSGVGLASVDAIVRAAGGRVELESTPGVGTTVRMLLPVTPPKPI